MSDAKRDAEEIRREIERTRADLAEAADALSAKFDVKAQAGRKADEVKDGIAQAAAKAKHAAPEPVQHAVDRTGAVVAPVASRAQPYRKQIAVGASLTAVLLVVVRRRRSR